MGADAPRAASDGALAVLELAGGRGRTRALARYLLAAAVALLAALAGAPDAGAAEPGFYVKTCGAAPTYGYDSSAFAIGASSRRMVVTRGCDPHTPGLVGLATRNRIARGRARYGEYAAAVLPAPPGTQLSHMLWAGEIQRRDCSWAIELYADRPGGRKWVARVPARRSCPRAHASRRGWGRPRLVSLGLGTRLVQRIVCRNRKGCATSKLNAISTYSAQVYVVDVSPPALQILGGGLLSGAWVRGSQSVTFAASDNVGVAHAGVIEGEREWAAGSSTCIFSHTVPCPSGVQAIELDTSRLPDGLHSLGVRAQDSAGLTAVVPGVARVDNTPPARVPVSLGDGEGWRRVNSFSVSWPAPAEPYAPVVAARAKLCPEGQQAGCVSARHAGDNLTAVGGLTVPGPGTWDLVLWREDAAGNESEGQASAPVRLRFDPDPPRPAFEPPSVADPTRVSAVTNDGVSGLAGGEIELRRVGTPTWQTLQTGVEPGDRLVARIDDAALPGGDYELRVRAVDRAGNEATSQQRVDGAPMVVTLPLRFDAVIRGGHVRTRMIRTTKARGKRKRRRVTSLVPALRAPLGRRVRLRGALANADGQPIAGATVYVFSRSPYAPESFVGFVTTDGQGRFSYAARAVRTRALRLLYLGTQLIRPSQREFWLLVPAATTLRASRRLVRNGSAVGFRGRLRGSPVPAGGKLVEMQAHFRGRWRTFSTVRTDARGRWRFSYRFGATTGRVRYRFRAVVPREGGYPFETGRSRTVTVTVVGR